VFRTLDEEKNKEEILVEILLKIAEKEPAKLPFMVMPTMALVHHTQQAAHTVISAATS
jgi:hypothetical protein